MADSIKLFESVYRAIDDINELQPSEAQIEKSPETSLFGEGSVLDSLGLVGLIVTVEENLQDDFGATVTLADERAMSQSKSPFLTIATLVDYINMLISESDNA